MLTFADIMHHYEQGAQGAGLDARQRGGLFALVEAARPVIKAEQQERRCFDGRQ